MDINALLKGKKCDCGEFHSCNIDYVYIENDAICKLEKICKDYRNILLVADENTYGAAGEKTKSVLKDKNLGEIIFSGKEILIPNEVSADAVIKKLDNTDLIIGIGSGVIQDLCKYVSKLENIPYIVVATAPSMDGYASTGAAMILKGMKETVAAGLPKAIIADTKVLKDAPMEMIKAGYGDIVGKFSALNDWKLSRAVNNEYFCQYIYDTTYDMIEKTLNLANGLLKRDEESVGVLMEALVVVGIMMSFAGSSRPASGSEHHLSHFFEIVGIVTGTDYLAHGIDVAYSTVVTAKIREKLLNSEFKKEQYHMAEDKYEEKIKNVYKDVADGCIALQKKLGTYERDRVSIYLEKEEEIRSVLAEMPKASEIEAMLKAVELDMSEFYEIYTQEKINDSIVYAKDLKDRYTVLWMNYDFYGDKAYE